MSSSQATMEVDIQDIVQNIKRKYLNIRADHLKQRSWHLKNVAELELVEEKGNIQSLFEEQLGSGGASASAYNQVGLNYTQLFRQKPQNVAAKHNTKLLVLGEAGVGKTMLCASIAEDWANGKLFQQFLMVLLLPLNQRSVASVNSLPELLDQLSLFSGQTKSHSGLFTNFVNLIHDNDILIIADEWDEYCKSSNYSTESFLHHLLFGNPFPNLSVSVMITARPGFFPSHMSQHIDQLITVRGFSKDTVAKCVHSEYSSNMERIRYLLRQLDDNMLVDSMCRVPLKLALISSLSHSLKEPLPNTMSELYKKICLNIAQISIMECEKYKNFVNLSSYHDFPEELQQWWWLICELAFRNIQRNIEKGCESFSQLEAATYSSTELESILYFGFHKSIPMGGDPFQFCFLHPFIEEYLAALHLARQKEAVQLGFIKLCTENMCQYLTYFWRFYFGTIVNENMYKSVVQAAVQMLSKWHSFEKCEYLLCYYSLEAKNKLVNSEIVKALSTTDKSGSVLVNFAQPHNSQDFIAMIYVTENIDQKCSIEINFRGCNLNANEIIKLSSALSRISSSVQIQGLDLSDNNISDDSDSVIAEFFHSTPAAIFSLKKLFLCNCGIGTKSINAITETLAQSSSQRLIQLDLSFNTLSMSSLRTLQNHIESNESLVKLEILFLKGSLSTEVDMNFVASFVKTLAARCLCLRRLDLSSNDLGKPGTSALSSIISQLTGLRRDFDLSLNPEYMLEVDNNFIYTMEETIRNKGTIDHTIAHGIIVGPGRSGKNTLMNRLMGIRPDPDSTSPSTGVMETVVKVEVKRMCTVATAVSNLKWQRLEYDEEALELIMTTTKNYSASQPVLKPISKYVIQDQEQQMQSTLTTNSTVETCAETRSSPRKLKTPKPKIAKFFFSIVSKPFAKFKSQNSSKTTVLENARRVDKTNTVTKDVVVYSSDLEPVDILKRAVKLRRMDALREHLESSWSLYLTNTGGQIEFQEHLSLLACGPSIFFVTFPLHHNLDQPYEVRYEESDGQVKAYQSTTTLLEELLQTLATIDALNYANEQYYESEAESIKPKVFFIGTHRDKLEPETTADETIKEIDILLQKFVKQTSLFRQGSIQFAQLQPTQKLMFAVNNLSADDNEFQKIRSAVQQTVERRKDFTVTCPSSWLVFSLILRAKHKSSQVLSFEECFSIAQECGISEREELSQALSFIHSRLGLVRYFNVEGLNELVVIDPQILFDRITDLLVNTFTYSHVEVNQIEDFYQRGILPIAVVESINEKCGSDVQLPFPWLTKLLNYLRIAALFRDQDGDKYFFPAALCHAPEPLSNQSPSFNSPPHLLIGFESGFCPRGVPGALIKILMTNEMKSTLHWELRPNKIFRNQVSFGIESYGDVTLKFFPTHLEIFLDSDIDITQDELSTTCTEACTQIKESMKIVSNQFSECPYFLGFYCTLTECQAHPHPAKIEWRGSRPSKLNCKIMHKQGRLPTGYNHYFFKDIPHLDKEIDFCNKGVPKHIGQIAESMAEWEGQIAEELGLTEADVASIKTKHPSNLKLQVREALSTWKRKLGCDGTYKKLIKAFECAGYKSHADSVVRIVLENEVEMSIVDQNEEESPSSQPPTYPALKPPSPSPQLTPIQSSSQEHYVYINTATAKLLPKDSEVYNQDVLDSHHVRTLPILQENMVRVIDPKQEKEVLKEKEITQKLDKLENERKKSKWVSRYRPGVPIPLPGESARESIMQAELRHREDEFCCPRQLRVFCGTWNVNGRMPPADLDAWLLEYQIKDGEKHSPPPDIYAIGLQELDLSAQCLISKKSTREKPWIHCVTSTLRKAGNYIMVGYHRLVGIMLLVYIKQELYSFVSEVESDFYATGLMGNKGGVGIHFNVFHSSFCFINTQFTANMEEVEKRNGEIKILMDKLQFATDEYSYDISQHDMIYWIGDLNYRIQTSHEMTSEVIKAHADCFNFQTLLKHDQLLNEMKRDNVFWNFIEMPIDFKPTYKYDPGTNDWDSSGKHRPPAWCDRILYQGAKIRQRTYTSHPALAISDHKPVSALFDASVRVVDPKKEKEVLEEINWRLDKLESDTLPQVDLDKTEFKFQNVRFMIPQKQRLCVTNTGHRPVHISFIPKLDEKNICKPWLEVKPQSAVIHPLEDTVMILTVNVDEDIAPSLNNDHYLLEDILVLHLEKGKDLFITVSGNYLPSCFGSSLETLVHLRTYIREVPVTQLINQNSSFEQFLLSPLAGASLEQVPVPLDIPKELFTMVDFIKRKGAQEEGLFSDGGRSSEIEDIMNMLDTGGKELPGSAYSVASALLTFLAALSEPVVPFALHQRCMGIYNNTTLCKQVLTQMPKVHRRTFIFLITFMKHLLKYSEANGLDPKVLATIFGEVMLKTPLDERKSWNKRTINAMNRKKVAFIYQFLVNDLTKPYN